MSARWNHPSHRGLLGSAILALSACIPGANAFQRRIGALDATLLQVVDACFVNGTESTFGGRPLGYDTGKCSVLINCVYDGIDAAGQAGLSAGTSVACLLPTVLALVGAGPTEIIELAFASPIRAVATCMFGVGLPSGLFRQLRTETRHPSGGHSETTTAQDPCIRKWQIYIARPYSKKIDIARRILADCVILVLASIMLWRSWVIGSVTMVTFRCEYSWLLFCWPMACVTWLSLSCLALYCMAKEIEITLDDQPRSFLDIITLPYRSSPTGPSIHSPLVQLPNIPFAYLPTDEPTDGGLPDARTMTDSPWASSEQMARNVYGHSTSSSQLIPQRRPTFPDAPPPMTDKLRQESYDTARTAVGLSAQSFTLTIKMRKGAFWQVWEASVETVAVGIYLYATIVLGSTIFLTGQTGILYTVLMVLSLAVIRIVGNVM